MLDNSEIKDLLDFKPIAEAGQKVTEATVDGISSFLGSVFKPGLEELGFLLKDKVRQWRLNNILRVLDKAKGRMGLQALALLKRYGADDFLLDHYDLLHTQGTGYVIDEIDLLIRRRKRRTKVVS